MSREIMFKGMRIDGKGWAEGSLDNRCENIAMILTKYTCPTLSVTQFHSYPVLPETVGQYIGKKDMDDNRIFGGDVIKDESGRKFNIFFCNKHNRWEMKGEKKDGFNYEFSINDWFDGLSDLPKIIGSIHKGAPPCLNTPPKN